MRATVVAVLAAVVVLAGSPALLADGRHNGAAPSKPPSETSLSLVDHHGRRVGDADFRGKYLLVYFGYSYCVDLCPIDLRVLSEAVETLDIAGVAVQPIFVSLDPERDTARHLAKYVAAFHPRLIGLTGSPEETAHTARDYRVRNFKLYFPVENDDDDKDAEATRSEYTVQHSALTYLVGPTGRRLMTFPHGVGPDDMAREVIRVVTGAS